jgi:Flp pilus assembly pilin Flp
MKQFLKRFRKEDDGAVTVDWVVLTAAMAGFGFAVATIITTAANDPAEGMGARLAEMDVGN